MAMPKPSTPPGIFIRNRQEIRVPIEISSKMQWISSVGITIKVTEKNRIKRMMRIIFILLITRDMGFCEENVSEEEMVERRFQKSFKAKRKI